MFVVIKAVSVYVLDSMIRTLMELYKFGFVYTQEEGGEGMITQ